MGDRLADFKGGIDTVWGRCGNRVRWRRTLGKWENCFIKNYITCNVNSIGEGIKTTVTFVVKTVTKKNALLGTKV